MIKKSRMKRIILLLVVLVLAVPFSGCSPAADTSDSGKTAAPAVKTETPAVTNKITGTINAGGSTSVEKAALKALEEFAALNPGVTFEYDATGSSTGVTNANDGTYHIGFASRELKDSEKATGIKGMVIAMDGIAIAVNPSNNVADITMDQLQGIYKGEIKKWSDLGGSDAKIVVVSRENGSGTRGAFEELVGFEESLTDGAIIKDGNGNVATYVAGEANAIGYISFTTLEANKNTLKEVKVEGVEPTVANVVSGVYKVSRPFTMVYHDKNLNEAEKAFAEFLFSDDGQDALESAGAIKVK